MLYKDLYILSYGYDISDILVECNKDNYYIKTDRYNKKISGKTPIGFLDENLWKYLKHITINC